MPCSADRTRGGHSPGPARAYTGDRGPCPAGPADARRARSEISSERALPGGLAFEQKLDGYRALLFAGPGGAYLQSRNGADVGGAFPEIADAGRVMRQPLGLDGELVVATEGLDFGQLQQRARRRGAGARQAARPPAHLIVLYTADGPLLNEPYQV
ncbi:ATP-dependent DNA ligase [Streptomyces sp. NPDC003719]